MWVPNEGALLLLQVWLDAITVFPSEYTLRSYVAIHTPAAADTPADYSGGPVLVPLAFAPFSVPVMDAGVATATVYADLELSPAGIGGTVCGYIVYRNGGELIIAEEFDPPYVSDASPDKRCVMSGLTFGLRFNPSEPGLYPWPAYRSTVVHTTADTITVSVPSYAEGDKLVCVIVTNSGSDNPSCDGWELAFALAGGTPPRIAIMKRDADSEPSSYDFDVGGTASAAVMFTVRNASTIGFWAGYATEGTGTTDMPIPGDLAGPAVNINNSRMLQVWTNAADEAITAPGTSAIALNVSAGPYALLIATEKVAEGATFPSRTATLGTAEPWTSLGISLDKNP